MLASAVAPRRAFARLGFDLRSLADPSNRVLLGRCLLIVTGVVVSAPMPLLHLSWEQTWAVIRLSVAMTTLLGLSFAVPWSKLPETAVLAFPISVFAGLATLGVWAGSTVGNCFTGLFVLGFAYVGASCRPRAVFWLLPAAVPAYVASVGQFDANIAVRLFIALTICTLLGELLSQLTAHQQVIMRALQNASRTDGLTGLANRRDFDERLPRLAIGDTVVMCDLDHFKAINDTEGHTAGDQILRDFGAVLSGALRGDDYAARYGGEEFVLFLVDTNEEQTRDVLARLHRRWAAVHPTTTFSSGYATCRQVQTAIETLKAADLALFAAKDAGRNCDVDAGLPTPLVGLS